MKKCLDKVEYKNFTASNGWLEKWKISYGVRERKVNDEAGEVAEYTVSVPRWNPPCRSEGAYYEEVST